MWKDYVVPEGMNRKASGDNTFQAKVIEVRSGDLLIIQRAGKAETMTVSLSSIRCPRQGNRAREEPDEPWAYEAKEFVRSKLIGQNVGVRIDYLRMIQENERPFVAITVKGQDIAVGLCKQGLCTTQRHRGDDERAENYEALQEAENEAREKNLRLHNEKASAPQHRFNEMSKSGQTARGFLPYLEKERRVAGIVDYLSNAGRLRLTLPKHAASISFALSGVQCPGVARADGTGGQEFGPEALAYARAHVLQREVNIEVETVDRGGSFLGSLFLNGTSLGVQLLEQGFAWCSPSVDRSPYCQQLQAAEQKAKSAKLRVWANYDEEAEARKLEEAKAADAKATPRVVQVEAQHVTSGDTFYVHMLGDEAKPLNDLRAKTMAGGDFGPPNAKGEYRVNQYCHAEYGGEMYRAKVVKKLSGDRYEVYFVDYGNEDTVSVEMLDPWREDDRQPPLAYECKLAYVRAPGVQEEWGDDAGRQLASFIMGKQLSAQIVAKSGDCFHLMLFDGKTSINAAALKSGLTRLTKEAKRKPPPTSEFKMLVNAADEALKRRMGMFEYGDCGSDEDER